MPYLIDGHNLIGKLPDISLDDPNDEAKLVQKLAGFAARTRKRCIVVFDNGLPGGYSTLSTHSVKVIFAASQRTNADRIMLERIRNTRDCANWTVISSDNEVLRAASQAGMQTMRSAAFATRLQKRERVRRDPRDESANVYVSPQEVDEWLKIFGEDQ
jgi:hypothetical protein